MGYITLPIALIVIPIILAAPWTVVVTDRPWNRLLLCWPLGYFLECALFQFLCVPFTLLGLSFTSLCAAYLALLIGLCGLSLWHCRTLKPLKLPPLRRPSVREAVCAIVALGLIVWQVYRSLRMDRTVMSYDDSYYVAIASDTLAHNALYVYDAYTGLYTPFAINRVLQTSLVFPAFLSWLSGASVVLMEHTILDVYYLLTGYAIYFYMGSVLFKTLEDALIFLSVVSAAYIFGYYSIYSPTFRFLGMSYQGKAVLAVLFFPMLFTAMIEALDRPYRRRFGALLLLLSAAACGLTLFGAVTMISNVALPLLFLMFTKAREWKKLWYVAWASLIPALNAGIFLLYRLAI